MRILLTNDDGIHAEGLAVLERIGSLSVSFANIPAGKYEFNCTPHLAMGMKGVITVE